MGLIVAGTALTMFVPVTWSSYRLHHEATASTSQVGVQQVRHCLRSCWYSSRITVWFPDAEGSTREAVLRGVAQDLGYYQPGIGVVYDATKPQLVMAARDYQDGRGLLPKLVIPTALLLALGQLVVAVRFIRRELATRRRRTRRGGSG
jgi:hypothetical protein